MKGLEPLLNPDEHMNDDEKGLHAEQFDTDLALLQHQHAHGIDPSAVSAHWCDECDMEIPEARREALLGVRLCVDCAMEEERREKQWR